MSDWAPVFIPFILFVLLSPGLIIQIPGKNRFIELSNFQTSGISVLIHSLIFFALTAILLIAVRVHMFMGN